MVQGVSSLSRTIAIFRSALLQELGEAHEHSKMRELRIELVYDRDCPNVEQARAMIQAALAEVGAVTHWTEWDREDARTPNALRHYGSPTVLVNGRDVSSLETEEALPAGNSCRVYAGADDRLRGAPPAALIATAIRARSFR